ncbi:hypothetical protein JCM11641_007435 [Rhodosporidiobolus odoratus]
MALAWAHDARNLEKLFYAQYFKSSESISYRHVPSPGGVWERLNVVEQGLPASRGVRTFCEEGKVMRALFLENFTTLLFHKILGIKDIDRLFVNSGTKPTDDDHAQAEISTPPGGSDHHKIVVNTSTSTGVKLCSACPATGRVAEENCGAADTIIKSCFKQLDEGKADQSHPPQLLLDSSLPLLNEYLHHPQTLFSFTIPGKSGRFTIPLPESITPYSPALSALRSFPSRSILSGGQDLSAVGYLCLFACCDGSGARASRRGEFDERREEVVGESG